MVYFVDIANQQGGYRHLYVAYSGKPKPNRKSRIFRAIRRR
jgi:hypothetical protein